jgi:hypothetical protein
LTSCAVLDRVKLFLPQIEKVGIFSTTLDSFWSSSNRNFHIFPTQANKELEEKIKQDGAKSVQIDAGLLAEKSKPVEESDGKLTCTENQSQEDDEVGIRHLVHRVWASDG